MGIDNRFQVCYNVIVHKGKVGNIMKDLKFYTQYAKSLLDSLNIPYVDCPVSVNTRLTKTWGQCWHKRVFGVIEHRITLNPILLRDTTEDDALMNTLLHEYLHTCPKCDNHGAVWKHYADLINNKYHYNIKRCTSSEEKGLNTEEYVKYKYEVSCPDCGHTWRYLRKSNGVKGALANHRMSCPYCGYIGKNWKVKTNL